MELILAFLLLISCGDPHEKKESTDTIEHALEVQQSYITSMGWGYDYVTAGDALTFISMRAASNCDTYLYNHEYSYDEDLRQTPDTGQWNRYTEPVFETGRSRSGCSFECALGALRYLYICEDRKGLDRYYQYLENNDWRAGAGPKKYSDVSTLKGLFGKASKKLRAKSTTKGFWSDILKSYKAAVVANYIELYGRVRGYIEDWHLMFMDELAGANPDSPLYSAIYHRYYDGDQSETLERFAAACPEGDLPEPDSDIWGWADAPSAILCIFTVDVIKD